MKHHYMFKQGKVFIFDSDNRLSAIIEDKDFEELVYLWRRAKMEGVYKEVKEDEVGY